jgi:hypothetical protein
MECYSAIKKNKIVSFAGKWVEVESTMLREISQSQKDKHHVFSHNLKEKSDHENIRKKKGRVKHKGSKRMSVIRVSYMLI